MIKRILVALTIITITVFAWTETYEAGTTTHDFQNYGSQGNRVIEDTDGNVHLCWTCSKSQDTLFADKAVYYNRWNADQGFSWEGGIKVPGNNITGFCTMGLLPDGRAVIACNEGLDGDEASVVFIDSEQGTGDFVNKVYVDDESVNPQPLYPHIEVDVDGVIHVIARSMDPADSASSRIYYSRSTDEGQTFSDWELVIDETVFDAELAVSRDSSKVAIVWIEPAGEYNTVCGHVKYKESLDGGQTWGEVQHITDGRYSPDFPAEPDYMYRFAHATGLDAEYDLANSLHVVYREGWFTRLAEEEYTGYQRLNSRIVHWNREYWFSVPSATYFPMFSQTTDEGDTIWQFDSLGMWGALESTKEPFIGCWNPCLSFSNSWKNIIVVMWCGQRDSLDTSSAGTVNADIYAAMSLDNGITWDATGYYDLYETDEVWRYISNVTQTHTPGSEAGESADENYLSISPVFNPELDGGGEPYVVYLVNLPYFTYIEDKFAGPCLFGGTKGYLTQNPVMLASEPRYAVEENRQEAYAFLGTQSINQSRVVISFTSPLPQPGILRVRNALGQTIRVFELETGTRTLTWDGCDARGLSVPSGVYFVELRSGSDRTHGKVTLVR